MKIKVAAGAVGTEATSIYSCSSDSTKMMQLLLLKLQ
jgi:hypothetical protein